MSKIKVLIADDSVVYRSQIRAALQNISEVEVIAATPNGKLAIERMQLAETDVLILDLEMPEMDGLETLKEINRLKLKTKVIMFSSVSKRGAEITMEALRLGAVDFIAKPSHSTDGSEPSEKIRFLLEPKIKGLFSKSFEKLTESKPAINYSPNFNQVNLSLFEPEIVVIGSSTGGPTILEKIFSKLNYPLKCPIVITQHMPPIFTTTLAERISKLSGISCVEAQSGMILKKNTIYIAPGDFHLKLEKVNGEIQINLNQGPQINFVRPAVDPLFISASEIFKNKCLGLVLTGMGSDGKAGAESIKQHSGAVIIQDEASCVVFGMPGAVKAVGAYDKISSPDEIIHFLNEKVCESKASFENLLMRKI